MTNDRECDSAEQDGTEPSSEKASVPSMAFAIETMSVVETAARKLMFWIISKPLRKQGT